MRTIPASRRHRGFTFDGLTWGIASFTVTHIVKIQGRLHCVDWDSVDMSTPIFPDVVPGIDANPVRFTGGGRGLGQV